MIRWESASKASYQHLIARGKPHKVSPVAVMRRLRSLLNTVFREARLWQPEPPTRELAMASRAHRDGPPNHGCRSGMLLPNLHCGTFPLANALDTEHGSCTLCFTGRKHRRHVWQSGRQTPSAPLRLTHGYYCDGAGCGRWAPLRTDIIWTPLPR